MQFNEIIKGIEQGIYKQGAEFETVSGEKVIYLDGALRWVTVNGYASSTVRVNDGVVKEKWEEVDNYNVPITFTHALEELSVGNSVKIKSGFHFEEILRSLNDLEHVIINGLFLSDVYTADFFTVGISKTEPTIAEAYESAGEAVKEVGKAFGSVTGSSSKGLEKTAVDRDRYSVKLTASDAYDILYSKHYMGKSVDAIAEQYNVSQRMIYYILDGTHWNEVYTAFHK